VLALPLHHMKYPHVSTTWNAFVDVIIVTNVRNFVGWIEYLVANRVPSISVALSGGDVSRFTIFVKDHELSIFLRRR